jgi:glycerophosphoryl diester phosphodiesterase
MRSSGSFQIIGHRGASGIEPENTLRSFARALAIGVDAIELDVYCVEGKLIVIHDDTLERTTSGRGKVMATSFAALRKLDAGQGERIPTLEEVLALVADRVMVNIELKGGGTAEPVAACIAAHAGTDVLVSSFDHSEVTRFRAVAPLAHVAPLFHRATPTMFDTAGALDAWAINLSVKLATGERLRAIADHGYRSFVYTVNDPVVAAALKADGATGVFTDFPDRMQALRA